MKTGSCRMGAIGIGIAYSLVGCAGPRSPQITVGPVEEMPRLPQPFALCDWAKVAKDFDQIAFDRTTKGEFLPLLEDAEGGPNYRGEWYGMRAYIGQQSDGNSVPVEGLTMFGSVLGATLVGIDKRHDPRGNFVEPLRAFFNESNGERIFLNRTSARSAGSAWYVLAPNILAWQIGTRYPGVLDREMTITAARFLEASEAMRKLGGGKLDFNHNGWDFVEQKPFDNQRWQEPDAAAGFAWMHEMAWLRTADRRHLQAAHEALAFLDERSFEHNPLYEVILPFGAYTAARMNAETGSTHDVNKLVHWCFGPSETRFGWGVVNGRWGDFDVAGLGGSLTDSNGFGFTMNTFLSAATLAPIARYDDRYARAMGRYLINAANAARLLYPQALPADHQTSFAWAEAHDPNNCIAYEGLRHEWDGKSPVATGDPVRLGWGKTDLGLYGSGYVGFLGAMMRKTNVAEIPGFDLVVTETSPGPAFPTTLYYNPRATTATITVPIAELSDLYDTVANRFLLRGAKDEARISIAPDTACVLVRIPAGTTVEERGGRLMAGDVVVDYTARGAAAQQYPNYAAMTGKAAIDRSRVVVVPHASTWPPLEESQSIHLKTYGRGEIECLLRFAWSEDALRVLITEEREDPKHVEAQSATAFTEFWKFDSVALYFDLQNRNQLEELKDVCVHLGFSSEGRTDLVGSRVAGFPQFKSITEAVRVTTSVDSASRRTIEAEFPWKTLAKLAPADRLPKDFPHAGWRFGCEPMLADNGWEGQSFVGGSMFSTPLGNDGNSIDLELQP